MAETQQEQDFNITETINKAEDFANKNKRSLMIIGGAIVLAVGGYLFYRQSTRGKFEDSLFPIGQSTRTVRLRGFLGFCRHSFS